MGIRAKFQDYTLLTSLPASFLPDIAVHLQKE
jgi:hypothetical protein